MPTLHLHKNRAKHVNNEAHIHFCSEESLAGGRETVDEQMFKLLVKNFLHPYINFLFLFDQTGHVMRD